MRQLKFEAKDEFPRVTSLPLPLLPDESEGCVAYWAIFVAAITNENFKMRYILPKVGHEIHVPMYREE